jgi:hypothetical protein
MQPEYLESNVTFLPPGLALPPPENSFVKINISRICWLFGAAINLFLILPASVPVAFISRQLGVMNESLLGIQEYFTKIETEA